MNETDAEEGKPIDVKEDDLIAVRERLHNAYDNDEGEDEGGR